MIEQSESVTKLATAMVAVHNEAVNPVKDSRNPHFKSTYASLESVLTAVRPVLQKHGLAVLQLPATTASGPGLMTQVMHASGEFLRSVVPLCNVKNDPQAVGSAITYARRYALLSLLGITAEDDDGNAATVPLTKAPQDQQPKQQAAKPQQQPGKYTDKQMDRILEDRNLTWPMVVSFFNKTYRTKYRDGTEISQGECDKFFAWLVTKPAGYQLKT